MLFRSDGMLPHANALCIHRYEPQHHPCVPHDDGHEGSSKKQLEDWSLRPSKPGVSALLTPESPPKTPGKTPASLDMLSGIHPGVWTGVQTGDSGPTGDSGLSGPARVEWAPGPCISYLDFVIFTNMPLGRTRPSTSVGGLYIVPPHYLVTLDIILD